MAKVATDFEKIIQEGKQRLPRLSSVYDSPNILLSPRSRAKEERSACRSHLLQEPSPERPLKAQGHAWPFARKPRRRQEGRYTKGHKENR